MTAPRLRCTQRSEVPVGRTGRRSAGLAADGLPKGKDRAAVEDGAEQGKQGAELVVPVAVWTCAWPDIGNDERGFAVRDDVGASGRR